MARSARAAVAGAAAGDRTRSHHGVDRPELNPAAAVRGAAVTTITRRPGSEAARLDRRNPLPTSLDVSTCQRIGCEPSAAAALPVHRSQNLIASRQAKNDHITSTGNGPSGPAHRVRLLPTRPTRSKLQEPITNPPLHRRNRLRRRSSRRHLQVRLRARPCCSHVVAPWPR